MIRYVEMMCIKNNSRELILSGSLKNYKSKIYSQETKVKVCTIIVKPTVLYDCETWAMAQQKKNDSKI
jgi:hypothetical protein